MKQKNDYLWKGILEDVFDDFLRFMHPNADEIFDFNKGIVFLDKELEQLFPPETEDEYAIKIVDKLAKVYTREGEEEWVLIHCEVQAKYSVDFPRRMFTYFYLSRWLHSLPVPFLWKKISATLKNAMLP